MTRIVGVENARYSTFRNLQSASARGLFPLPSLAADGDRCSPETGRHSG
jgi:hypothetical protein